MPKVKEPPELVSGSFQHVIHMSEIYAKTYEYKLRTIKLTRVTKREPLGFTVREGDGWGITNGIFVSRIQFGHVFDICSLLSVGDEIVKIDEQDVKEMNIGEAIRQIGDCLDLTITVKLTTPFAKKRAGMRCRKIQEPPVSRVEDYKVLNMRIPRRERHVIEEIEEVPSEEQVEEGTNNEE